MATPVSGLDYRNSDNAHAWGDDETDVWIGRNMFGSTVELPRNAEQMKEFLQDKLPLGWLEESGVPINTSVDSTDFKALQGSSIIKSKVTSVARDFTVQALEENVRVTQLYWDHDKPKAVAAGESVVDIKNTLKTINCWAILQFVEGDYWKVYVFPSVDITDRGTLDHNNTAISIYQMTGRIRKDGWMFTNNPAYQEGMREEDKTDFAAANA